MVSVLLDEYSTTFWAWAAPQATQAASRPDCSRCLICMASLPGTGYLPEKSLMRNAFTDTMMGSTITVTSAAP